MNEGENEAVDKEENRVRGSNETSTISVRYGGDEDGLVEITIESPEGLDKVLKTFKDVINFLNSSLQKDDGERRGYY